LEQIEPEKNGSGAGVPNRSQEGVASSPPGLFVVAFILSFLFMYMILLQFETSSIPSLFPVYRWRSVRTGFWRPQTSCFSSLGFHAFGVVKKNSILQIDHMNNLQHEGCALWAIIQACATGCGPF
jgi:HAE1 family hydrophobic/amphiphilic exporter-1